MGIIRRTYNFLMTLIGLFILGLIAYVFLYGKWQDYREEKYFEEQQDLISEAEEAARERGLGDLDQLRQEYLALCPANDLFVLEGNVTEICEATADALLSRSRERTMTLSDHVDLAYELCALDAEQDGGDPEDYCDQLEDAEYTIIDALALSLCEFDRAWLFDRRTEEQLTKRGSSVYSSHEQHVDCEARVFKDYYYEGFFAAAPEEDEDWPPVLEQVYDALESEDHDRVIALLDSHEFGVDAYIDRWMLNMVLEERHLPLLPEVLARNGGKVNFDDQYYNQPLSHAIEAESSATALALLEAGADPVHPHRYGMTPIVEAATDGMLDVVKELVARGADVNGIVGSESLDFGEPLRRAARYGHEETALWLLQNGAAIAPDDPSRYPRWSADDFLESAVVGGDLAVVRAFVEMGAKSTRTDRVVQGAVSGGNPEVLQLLFEQGYEMPEVSYHDRIYDAVIEVVKEERGGRIEDGVRIFELLLEHGLDMSKTHDSGWNYAHQAVIHYAPNVILSDRNDERAVLIFEHRLRFVKRVIDEVLATGVSIDHRYESETLLMQAADGGHAEIVRYLLDLGADATLRNDADRTALDIAVSEGRRLSAFWDERVQVREFFAETVVALGGSPDMLDPPEPTETQ